MADSLAQRVAAAPAQINPKLIFKLDLVDQGNVDEANLSSLGLRLLARAPGKAVVVFPDNATLEQLRAHLAAYSAQDDDGNRYRFLDSVEAIAEVTRADRVGPILADSPISDGYDFLDLELYRPDDDEQAREWMSEVGALAARRDGTRVTDRLLGRSLCLMRVRCDAALVDELLEVDYVKQLERRPQATFERVDIDYFALGGDATIEPIHGDTTGIVVVDSGVMAGHPLLSGATADAQVFGDPGGAIGRGGAEDVDSQLPGHGTAVSGLAVYGSLRDAIATRRFVPTALLLSARVTNELGEYDETELLETQLLQAVEYFLGAYPQARVVNLSLGDANHPYDDGYQFRLAAMVDEIAYAYRDRNILFVISAGNYYPADLTHEEILGQYPEYLGRDDARILDPATAATALTVGGLSIGAAAHDRVGGPGVERPVAGVAGFPSPFSRRGPGVNGAVKPEVVDDAGDLRFERGFIAETPGYAGVPTTSSTFAPPDGRLLKLVAGTSFAAPKVANVAARLFDAFPGATSNLVRALIAESAVVPDVRPPSLAPYEAHENAILDIYGYGQPDFERARWSAENAVVLAVEDSLPVDTYRVYEIPPLPPEFLQRRGNRYLRLSLAFDPPTRPTRYDSYLGITMQARLIRNSTPAAIVDAMRSLSADERAALAEGEEPPALSRLAGDNGYPTGVALLPGPRRREKGTLQRGVVRIANAGWRYNGGPLHLLVVAQRKWAPLHVTDQRFAAVVSVSHDDPAVDLYARLRERSRIFTRVRARV